MRAFVIAFVRLPLGSFTLGNLFRIETGEVIPPLVVFSGMALTEHPPVGVVRAFGRGAGAHIVAAVTVAQAHGGSLAPAAISAPAGEPPTIRSTCSGHRFSRYPLAPRQRKRNAHLPFRSVAINYPCVKTGCAHIAVKHNEGIR